MGNCERGRSRGQSMKKWVMRQYWRIQQKPSNNQFRVLDGNNYSTGMALCFMEI